MVTQGQEYFLHVNVSVNIRANLMVSKTYRSSGVTGMGKSGIDFELIYEKLLMKTKKNTELAPLSIQIVLDNF